MRILVLLSIFLAFGISCTDTQKTDSMIVVYAGAGSKLERVGNITELKRGMLLGKLDIVITGSQGVVDLQSTTGALVRIQKFSKLQINSLGQNTKLNISQGSMMARIDKRDSDQKFVVSSPTLIAGVRGTTFKVGEDGIKVIEGKVAVKPRIQALEQKTKTQIEDDPVLKNLLKYAEDQEQVIEAGQNAKISDATATKIQKINTAVEKKEKIVTEILVATDILQVEKDEVSLKDKADRATIVGVDEKLVKEITKAQSSNKKNLASKTDQASDAVQKLEKEYNLKRDMALDNLEKETLKGVTIANEADIRKYYEIIETVHVLNSANIYKGAVLAQAGGILVVHTQDGISRLPVSNIDYIDYK